MDKNRYKTLRKEVTKRRLGESQKAIGWQRGTYTFTNPRIFAI